MSHSSRHCLIVVILGVCLSVSTIAQAEAPKITRLSVRGLQTGGTTTVTVTGSNLLPDPKLLLNFSIKSQRVLEKAADNNVTIEVTLDKQVTPGIYNLRLMNSKGVTPALVVAVDPLPQVPVAEKIETLPVACHGNLTGSRIEKTTFSGKAGQSVTIDVESQRIGAKLRPVVHLYDANRKQIAWSLPMPSLAGDTRLQVELPADGTYTIELHDLQYAAPAPGDYRLKIGEFHYADLAYPPVVAGGKKSLVELIGTLGGNPQVEVDASGKAFLAAPWPSGSKPTGGRALVQVSQLTELVEDAKAAKPHSLPSIPVAISGRLDAPRQEDVYRVPVTEGDKLRFDLFASRLGSPLDAKLELRKPDGAKLSENDDKVGADPQIDYTVAKGVSAVDVVIQDVHRRGNSRCIYRLVVSHTTATTEKQDFRLRIKSETYNVAGAGQQVFPVEVERLGYQGPIRVTVEGLPSGMKAAPVEIPADAMGALLVVANENNTAGAACSVATIRGESVGADPVISRVAQIEAHPLAKRQPWLQTDIAIASAEPAGAGLKIDWGELAADAPLPLGTRMTLPVKLIRAPGSVGPIKLSMVTGFPVPKVNGRPDANRALRGERPTVDIPGNAPAKAAYDALAAAEKALADLRAKSKQAGAADAGNPELQKQIVAASTKRDEAEKALREAESKISDKAEFKIIIPAELPGPHCAVAFRAELRSPDNKTLLAEVFSPVRPLAVLNPLGIKLTGGEKLEAKLDPKSVTTVALVGQIERKAGFAGDVTLTTTGQPAGVAAPRVVLKPDQSEFKLELKFPGSFAAGEIDSIKIDASGKPDPKQNVTVKNTLPISIHLTAPEPAVKKPAAEKPTEEKKP